MAFGSPPHSERMRVAFADCVFDLSARQLWRNGEMVPLEPKMYELLEILIQRRPAVVTNEELDELLWPQVYVARTSLTRLVSELRSVLGDTPQESKMIRTDYKKGYAFCGNATTPLHPAQVILEWRKQMIPLSHGEHLAGRGAECAVIIDANSVSRRHARIIVNADLVTIEDLASTNGTRVNGMRIKDPTPLPNGSRIYLGNEEITLRAYDPSALTVKTDSTLGVNSDAKAI